MQAHTERHLRALHPSLFELICCFDCDGGWYYLLHAVASAVDDFFADMPDYQRPVALSVKARQGRLWINLGSPPEKDWLIWLQEAALNASTVICEECGAPARKKRGYAQTLCDEHRLFPQTSSRWWWAHEEEPIEYARTAFQQALERCIDELVRYTAIMVGGRWVDVEMKKDREGGYRWAIPELHLEGRRSETLAAAKAAASLAAHEVLGPKASRGFAAVGAAGCPWLS